MALDRTAPVFHFPLTAIALVVAVAGCNKPPPPETEEAKSVQVATEAVEAVEVPQILRFTGSLKGMQESDLAANASGRVKSTLVERGTEVEAGTIIAQLDTSAAALSLAEAAAQVAQTQTQEEINEADCERYEKLKPTGAISAAEYDQVTAKCKTAPLALKAAKARQSIAAKNVGDGTIRAPFSGVISERFVSVGEYVQPPSRVVTIAQIGELRLEFTVPEASFAAIQQGADVSFSVAAYPDTSFNGKVAYIAGSVRPTTRDLVVEAIVDNPDRRLRPGMFADVSLTVGTVERPAVPLGAVFTSQEKQHVFVVVDGRLEERVLHVGPKTKDHLAVLSGIELGESVVVGDLEGLKNGDRVE